MSATVETILLIGLVYAIATIGLSLVVGYAGIFSVSQAALFGFGGYTYAVLASRGITRELFAVLPIAIGVVAVLSVLAALPALRLRGDYFLVASIGFQIVVMQTLVNFSSLSGGPPGIYALPMPKIFGTEVASVGGQLTMIAGFTAAVAALAVLLVWSPYGRLLRALSNDEVAVGASGANILWVKLGVFVFAGALAAVGGVLYVSYLGVASPTDYQLSGSIGILAMVLIGGAGSVVGPIFGALILASLPYWLSLTNLTNISASISNIIFGGVLVGVAAFSPDGLAGIFRAGRVRLGRLRGTDVDSGEVAL
jgi:branched-chain amino acid transport system permease protein